MDRVDFEKGDSLVPCVTQHALTGEVLMVAWMDETALERTLETGLMHYWSRSRQRLWQKGETSGNTLQLASLSVDCDGDTLLAQVHPTGPACHTGEPTCFFQDLQGEAGPTLAVLWQVIDARASELPEGSWTTRLLTEEGLVEEKVLEEAGEVVDRAAGQGEDPLAHELADLFYHALVLARKHDLSLEDVLAELEARRR